MVRAESSLVRLRRALERSKAGSDWGVVVRVERTLLPAALDLDSGVKSVRTRPRSPNSELLPSPSVRLSKDNPALALKDRLVSAAPVED